MCECGCRQNDTRYTLPGPNGSVYLISLIQACRNCDGPSGIEIDQFTSEADLLQWCCEMPPSLPVQFESHGHKGTNIETGFLGHEFKAALKGHLIGLKSDDLADEPGQGLDEFAVEEILDEMYDSAQFRPQVIALPSFEGRWSMTAISLPKGPVALRCTMRFAAKGPCRLSP